MRDAAGSSRCRQTLRQARERRVNAAAEGTAKDTDQASCTLQGKFQHSVEVSDRGSAPSERYFHTSCKENCLIAYI